MTVTDKELSQSKHMSVPAEGSRLPFRQTTSTSHTPRPPPLSQCIVGRQINNPRRRRRRSLSSAQPPQQGCVFLKASWGAGADSQAGWISPLQNKKKKRKGKGEKYGASPWAHLCVEAAAVGFVQNNTARVKPRLSVAVAAEEPWLMKLNLRNGRRERTQRSKMKERTRWGFL